MKANKLTKETIMDLGIKDRGFPPFRVGDTIRIAQKVKEGNKERIQIFKGDVLSIHNNGISSTFTVRRMGADNIGVERIFPYFSPMIDDIKVDKRGDVCRAKLYYIRDRVGKASRIKEKIMTKEQKEAKRQKNKKVAPAKPEVVAKEKVEQEKKEE